MIFKNIKLAVMPSLAAVFIIAACNREVELHAPTSIKGVENMSLVKFVHAAPNFRTVVTQSGIITRDSFNLFINNSKINPGGAGVSGFFTYSSMFPGQTTGYVGINPGLNWFRLSLNGVRTADSSTLHSFQKVLEPGQKYSYIITDSLKSTNENRQMFLKDNFNTPVPGNYGVRFVHAVHSDTVGKNVDVYSFRRKANIFSNIKIGDATGFFEYGPSGNDTLSVRRAGSTFELARLNGIGFTSTRVYTVIYRGLNTTTGTKPRSLTFYLNN